MADLRINLGALVKYLSASGVRRRSRATEIKHQAETEYAVESDFWKQMRTAIYNDRRYARDGSLIRLAADEASAKKRASYGEIAERWPAIAERWAGAKFHRPSTVDLSIGGLAVSVKPLFSEEWPDGTIEDVAVWMNVEVPTDGAVRGALRLMTRAEPEVDSIATFVDVRRGRVWTGTGGNFVDADEWLERVGAQLLKEAMDD